MTSQNLRQCNKRNSVVRQVGTENASHGRTENRPANGGAKDSSQLYRGRLDTAGHTGIILGDVADDGVRG